MSAEERLAEKGLSITRQRVMILDYLMTHHVHPVMEQIYHDLVKDIPTLSLTSVYNTVKLLNEQGLVQVLTIEGKQVCIDENTAPHGHLLCTQCGRVYDVPLQGRAHSMMTSEARELKDQETAPHRRRRRYLIDGNEIHEVHQYYKGICKNCLERSKAARG